MVATTQASATPTISRLAGYCYYIQFERLQVYCLRRRGMRLSRPYGKTLAHDDGLRGRRVDAVTGRAGS
ncbi:MAG: hypothetical protein ABI604_10905 [Nitrospirota bacterium]